MPSSHLHIIAHLTTDPDTVRQWAQRVDNLYALALDGYLHRKRCEAEPRSGTDDAWDAAALVVKAFERLVPASLESLAEVSDEDR